MSKIGKVFLVGAGPGDPELITVKGLNLLRRAETIVYDHLVSPELLNFATPEAEKIYVGKQDSQHVMEQGEINVLLVNKANEGKMVVRLKGGDPFVLGRGGEEALHLVEHNIPFEVVPGITSAIAGPAYAGIPVTYREMTSSFLVITGHQKTGKVKRTMDWEILARYDGTLIFLMGVHNVKEIVTQLMHFGKDAETPVALVHWATWNEQQTLQGTLSDIVTKVHQAKLKPPAVIVIGEVVRLSEKLDWFAENISRS